MRRILLVALVVFAASLAVLVWIDRATREEPAEVEVSTPAPQLEEGRGEQVEVPDDEGRVTQIALSGPLRLSDVDPETLVRRYELRARDSRSREGGLVEVEGIELEVFGEAGEAVDRRVEAVRGRLQVLVGEGPPRIDDERPIVLELVTAHLASGMEFAPLDLEIPLVEVRLGERSLRSEDPVQLTGRGLEARGRGLFADGLAELVRIEREPHVELTLQDGAQATLDAAGPLTFADRPDLGPGLAAIEAAGGALLTLEGTEPLEVEAPLVRLIGHVLEDPQRFVPLRAEAEGGVELRPREGSFRGERAEVEFGAAGLAERARLFGDQGVEFSLDLRGVDVSGLGREAQTDPQSSLPVEGRGASELVLTLGERATFALDGPASVQLPSLDATVESRGPIRGSAEEGLGYATLEAEDEVVARSGELELEAPRIEVEAIASEGEEAFARLTTRGATTARGPDEAGERRFELLARQGLVATRRGESYAVPRADDVELTVQGEWPLRARADQLRDLDGTTLAFEASGDVELDDPRGHGEGDRLVSHGREHAELWGRPGQQATLTAPQGELSADRIEGEGQRLAADGEVHALVTLEGFEADLRSRWLAAGPGLAPEGRVQEVPPDWALDAGGDVRAVVTTTEAVHELSSQLLHLQADEELREGRRRLVPAGLEARGEVDALYKAGGMVLHARGERLTYDSSGSGRLEALPGERIDVEGELPERQVTFTLSASTLEYGLDQLNAEAPDIEVEGLDLPLLGEEIGDADPQLRAVAGRLLVDRRSMLFSERVYIARVSGADVSWSLDADRVQLVGRGDQQQDNGLQLKTASR